MNPDVRVPKPSGFFTHLARLFRRGGVEDKQVERLAGLRQRRDAGAVERALERIRRAAGGDDNLMPPILEAVHGYATVGEICGAMREVFGEYQEQPIF